ncbi:probable inactive ATP-dependent zinc metalloprotease FTSHI 2, chloroplastic [Tanacetum coccineum]
MSLVLKAQVTTLDDGTGPEKRCRYFFRNWPSCSQVHARKKPMSEDVDYAAVAAMTDGMVGAELENIVEVATINKMRNGRTKSNKTKGAKEALQSDLGHLDMLPY